MENGITPVMNVGNGGYGNGGVFGNEGIWLFAILALMWGNGGMFGNRGGYNPQYATQDFVQNGFNFNDLQSGQSNIINAIHQNTYDVTNSLKEGQFELANQIRDVQALTAQNQALGQNCCCQTLRAIDGVNYNGAINTASINKNTNEAIQKVLDRMCQDKTEALQSRVNQLELAQAMCGVVKYPQGFSYAVSTPFNVGYNCGCGCGC